MSSSASNASVSVSGPRLSEQLCASNEDGGIPPKPSGSNDIGWNYEKLLKKNSYNEVKYNKCHKIVKQYVVVIGGDVKAYVMQPDEDKKIVREILLRIQKKKVDKKVEMKLREEARISTETVHKFRTHQWKEASCSWFIKHSCHIWKVEANINYWSREEQV